MDSIFHILRVGILTCVLVLCLQVRWGEATLEDHTMNFLTSSAVIRPIDEVATSVVVFVRNTWSHFTRSLDTNFSNALRKENQPGSRHLNLTLERSKKYVSEKSDDLRERVRDVAKRARSKFIDETEVPGQEDQGHQENQENLEE